MRVETKLVPNIETKIIHNGTTEVKIFISDDGKTFTDEKECLKHEQKLFDLAEGEKYITEISFNNFDNHVISSLLFGGYDVSGVLFFKTVITFDENIIEKINKFLVANKCRPLPFDWKDFNEGDQVIISDWIENENSDYPTYHIKMIKQEEAIKIVEDFLTELKSVLNK